jgi:hypothetical protein
VHHNNILVYNSNKMHKSQSLFYVTCASSWNYILEYYYDAVHTAVLCSWRWVIVMPKTCRAVVR